MIVYDFEIFMYDWLVVFFDVSTKEYTVIIDNEDNLKDYFNSNKNKFFVGYNNKQFDDIVLAGIFSDVELYTTMTYLMNTENKYSAYKALKIKPIDIISIDMMQDVLGMSLKQAEGYMNLSVEECSIPFNLERPLTKDEINEVIKYCKHDVFSTFKLLEYRKDYVTSKLNIIKLRNLPISNIGKTNAGLCATVLNAKRKEYNDELQYDIIPEIRINSDRYKPILDLYTKGKLDYNKKLKINICGIEHTLAYGGIHAAKKNFIYIGEMWNIDVVSFYPSMMIEYNFHSRNIVDPTIYKAIYDDRVKAKLEGDLDVAGAYKLVLNTTYGSMKSKYNELYDPKMANQVCITGQLLFVDLLEKIEPYCTLVQSNTDGILIIPKNKDKIRAILAEWQKRTRMNLDIDICNKIWQKDVNNYIMVINKNGKEKIKTKGAYVAQYEPSLRNNARILDIAVVDFFVKGIPPEITINKATDIFLFQYITKTGHTYDETYWEHNNDKIKVNNVNRVYSSKNINDGKVLKCKTTNNTLRIDSIANLPTHCIIDNDNKLTIDDIDKSWYILQANKRIQDFLN